jgi:hypothetical protein
MDKFKALLDGWKQKAGPAKTQNSYAVRLPLADAARLHALAEMFPGRSLDDIITDLLHVSLDQIAEAMPYERGPKVISQDDHGDPVYEDVGPTPRFMELARKHQKALQGK